MKKRRLIDEAITEPYPEHAKLAKVKDQSQKCGEFLEWLLGPQHYTLGEYHEHTDACWLEGDNHTERRTTCGYRPDVLHPAAVNVRKLLAQFFEIDEAKLENEKEQMLAELRKR